MAKLAQWLVRKAPQELDGLLEKLEGELDLTKSHALLASTRKEGGERESSFPSNINFTA